MKYLKIFGIILLVAGIAIILWAIFSSYQIFTAQKQAAEIFKLPKEEAAAALPKTGKGPIPTEEDIGKMLGEQLKGMIPLDFLPKMMNLVAWSIFAAILMSAGGKISGIGIKLLRKAEQQENKEK